MDRLENELRDVLTHESRALRTDLVDLDAVYAGAARRRRRRSTVVAGAAAVVLAAVAVPVTLALLDDQTTTPVATAGRADARLPTPPNTSEEAPSPAPSAVTPTTRPRGAAWSGAHVRSMTATSTQTIVVLGALGDTGACVPPDCLRLAQSRDGGRSFRALPVPDDALAGGADEPSRKAATDVRFGSPRDGWLYGDGLWSTHDGGQSWTRVSISGAVHKVAAARGTVWALVTGAGGKTQQLWSSPVASDSWSPVPGVSVATPGDVAALGSRVVVLGAGPSRAWVGQNGAFTAHPSPCASAIEAELSGSTSLWAKCVTGTAAYVVTSSDGTTWEQVRTSTGSGAAPNSLALGARSDKDALLALGPDEPLSDLYADGTRQPVTRPPTVGSAISYLGFTTVDVGYAIDGTHLWRTSDGGDTWTRLTIG